MISEDKLRKLIGGKAAVWADPLSENLQKYGIDTKLRVCHFLAQCLHESGGFSFLIENMNYSQQGLRKVFPKYFPDDNKAFRYARQPKAIGSYVYAGRMGNGPESSGEGFKYRGRGLIQCTGKNNYAACSKFLYGDDRLLESPELLATVDGAIQSACWFWSKSGLSAIADSDNIKAVTLKVNGGVHGLDGRIRWLNKCKEVL